MWWMGGEEKEMEGKEEKEEGSGYRGIRAGRGWFI